ncbi:MAG: protein phosphatase 2C domain-containing protein, partial [Firmicutes bacterium]|nr:protein phosphatase 2C domain-containing protein [Bacillota bacterium]
MRFAARSDVGLVRKQNQDAVAVRSDSDGLGLVVVADGMGGEAAGDVASGLALEAVTRVFFEPEEATGAFERLKAAVQQANARIFEEARQVEPYAGMGTTIVAAAATQDELCVAHVGDSRAYLLDSGGELTRLTQDHSLVNELVRRGQITPESAVRHPQRHVLSRSLGTEAQVQVET